jgi:tetratricopeptide (TPR) repeat protein
MIKHKIQNSGLPLLSSREISFDTDNKKWSYTVSSHIRNYIIALISIALLIACKRHSPIWEQMNLAEEFINTKPDSALAILEGIPTSYIKGGKTSARYALLKSMALDKNYMDTTTFDILQPAIDYYIKHGSPDEKLRTYYYQGRIYQNQGDDDSAMRSFMKACDLRLQVRDSLLLAHTLVAQGALYLKQYKTREFIHNNTEAAGLYEAIGRYLLEIKSYTKAINGYVMMKNKTAADSLMSICAPLVQKHPDGEAYLFPSLLSYTIELCSPDDIKVFLDKYQDLELTKDETMNFAQGYSKIGEYEKALTILAKTSPAAFAMDSLKYAAIKISILEKQGKYEQALNLYKDYNAILERYQSELLTRGLLFSDEKHKLEVKNLMEVQDKNRIIWSTVCGILGLVMIIGWLYYRNSRNKVLRTLAEKGNENLRLEQDNLRKEKEKAELETANLKLEISQLEDERDKLKELQRGKLELSKPLQDVIKERLNILNSLLAKEITNNDSYAEPYNKWIESVHIDKKKFMDSTRLAFAASHPQLMEYLEQHGLSTNEINYLCLYTIGLRGKEVGVYMQTKRHYIISHEIRKKLGIDEHETNIGLYIRKLMKDFEHSVKF